MTNLEVVTTALRMLGVVASNEAANAEDGAIGLAELNDLMLDLSSEGIDLGYPNQSSLSDDFPLSDSDAAQIKPLLAMRLYDFFPSNKLPETLPGRASAAHMRLQRESILRTMEESSTSHLPPGASNRSTFNITNG